MRCWSRWRYPRYTLSTYGYETLHGIKLLPVAARIKLFPNVLHLVIRHVEDGCSTECYGEITGVLAEGLLNTHTKSRSIFSKSIEIDVVHDGSNLVQDELRRCEE